MNHRNFPGTARLRGFFDGGSARDEADLPGPFASGRWPRLSPLAAGLLIVCAVVALLVWGAP